VASRTPTTIYDYEVTTIDGRRLAMDGFRGQVMLIVNVASRCGYTPQYRGLEALYRSHRDRGFVVLGFPCDQFGRQEPGTEAEIQAFCETRFGVSFPMFAKVEVNGRKAEPLFRFLKSAARGMMGSSAIKWNFTKFLVDRDGVVRRRYGPRTTPAELEPDVLALLEPGR